VVKFLFFAFVGIEENRPALPITIRRGQTLVLQALLPLLPKGMDALAVALAMVGAAVGAALWIAGARFSRYLVTLAAVAMGTTAGEALPRWCGWTVDGMGTAVGGAIVLGASAYVLHRLWAGLWSGAVLAVWAALGTWAVLARDQAWQWPARAGMTWPGYWKQVWDLLPPDVAHALPMVCGAAFVIGSVPVMVWPRAGLVFLYSAIGATLLVGMGAMAINTRHPQWFAEVSPQSSVQWAALVLFIAAGAGLQWQLYMRKPVVEAKESC
jgi:hypothetical protein